MDSQHQVAIALITDQEYRSMVLWIIGGLLSVLIALLSWIGNRVYKSLDNIGSALQNIERDLSTKITDVDRRVAKLEGIMEERD